MKITKKKLREAVEEVVKERRLTPDKEDKPEAVVKEEVDDHAATELLLFIENDPLLYGHQYPSFAKNLINKQARGIYDSKKAIKLFMYLVDRGAKKYAKDHGDGGQMGPSIGGFNKATRRKVAAALVAGFENEAEMGVYDDLLHKKYKKEACSKKHKNINESKKSWEKFWEAFKSDNKRKIL